METVALFRSCRRKEYRDQIIKMLRAVPGEYTRTAYRFQWIDPAVLEMIESGVDFRALSHVVDDPAMRAFPTRLLNLAEPPLRDDALGMYRFVFEVGSYVDVPADFETHLDLWASTPTSRPPETFITPWHPEWMEIEEIDYADSLGTWKRTIDFLTSSWSDFGSSVFFRPQSRDYSGTAGGPVARARQSEDVALQFFAYNPHLSDAQLGARHIHVSLGGLMGDLRSVPKIPRDGFFDVSVRFLEPGTATVQVEIRPDEQFSAYVPLEVRVEEDTSLDPSGPRILGTEWSKFLASVVAESGSDARPVASLLARLAEVFPGDPELMIQRGRLHLLAGELAAATDQFIRALEIRQDPRALWWSLIAAIRLDDVERVEKLVERLDHSNAALFEEIVEEMPRLPDRTVTWFAEIPGLAMGEDKAIRMVLAMLRSQRGETASVALVGALGQINPGVALQQARSLVTSNPDWILMRREAVSIALSSGQLELVEDDADVLVNYSGGAVSEFMATVRRLQPVVHPQRLPALLMANAVRLAGLEDPEGLPAAMELALTAAEGASMNGDFISAQQALHFMEMRIIGSEERNLSYRPQINSIAERITRALNSTADLSEAMDLYHSEIATELSNHYRGRRLVVFGGRGMGERLGTLAKELGLASAVQEAWSGDRPPEPNKLRELVDDSTTVIVISMDDGLLPAQVRQFLRTTRTPFVRCLESRSSVLQALGSLVSGSSDPESFAPANCTEAVEWVKEHCQMLEFSPGALDRIVELDRMQNCAHVARRIVRDLRILDKFAVASNAGRVGLDFFNWCRLEGYSAQYLAMDESETTRNNASFRQQRTFRVPVLEGSARNVFMPAHFKLPGIIPIKPRIHFTIDLLRETGKAWVGFIGPHLDNSQT